MIVLKPSPAADGQGIGESFPLQRVHCERGSGDMGMLRNPMLAVDEVFSPGPPPYFVILSEGAYRKVEECVRNTSDRVKGSLSGAGRGELLSRV